MPIVAPPRDPLFEPAIVWMIDRATEAFDLVPFWPTSWWRDPATNARVGGASQSQHLVGTAFDAVPRVGPVSDLVTALRQRGLIAVDEGDHAHAQVWPRGSLRHYFAALKST